MRIKFMNEGLKDALHAQGRPEDKSGSKQEQNKSKGESKTLGKSKVKCWKCGKQ